MDPDLSNLDTLSPDQLLFFARLAEQSERYEGVSYTDMATYMHSFVSRVKRDLAVEERNILSVAYKNVVGMRRASWRVLLSIENKEEKKGNVDRSRQAKEYRLGVEVELTNLCRAAISLVADLVVNCTSGEGNAFYNKMRGDYNRYICEFATGLTREVACEEAKAAYAEAYEVARTELPASHPIRLGIALNSSVFNYEILADAATSCALARLAYDEATAELGSSDEHDKDTALILQLLTDNLSLWGAARTDDN